MTALGVLSMLLAAIGLYSVLSQAVSERAQEIGIRMALGATPADAARIVLARVAGMTGPGLILGLVAAVGLAAVAQPILAEVRATDPPALAGAVTMLSTVAILAGLVPTLRATRVSPADALRNQ